MTKRLTKTSFLLAGFLLAACPALALAETSRDEPALTLETEKFELKNGLNVIFHNDRSDPILAISLSVHVGSSRENPNRTGFAHLFEHLMFQNSENMGYLGLEKLNLRIGGDGTNGWTSHDLTQYYQVAPNDALEKIIWAESEKLGYFINTVSQNQIDAEKKVVKNEKRETDDNVPYGHLDYVIGKALYPEDHPYNWQVIGSLDHLEAATVADARTFFKNWYVPNNATLTLVGDFDPKQAKTFVERYFGEIPRGKDIAAREPRWSHLDKSKSLFHEDRLAAVPMLTYVWPAPDDSHPDRFALDLLADYWSSGEASPFDQILIDDRKLASSMDASYSGRELAGEFHLQATAKDGIDLDELPPALDEALARFEANGIPQAELDRLKAGAEVDFYNDIESVLDKAELLGEVDALTGNPQAVVRNIAMLKAVTREAVRRVYDTYIKGKPLVAVSFVPKGKAGLVIKNAVRAEVFEEKIVADEEEQPVDYDPDNEVFTRTPAMFDRSVEPPYGPTPVLPKPDIWQNRLPNGLALSGIYSDETPIVSFSMRIDAGQNRGTASKPAIPILTAEMLDKGTSKMPVAEFEAAVDDLGSSIDIETDDEHILINGTSLSRNFAATFALVADMVLAPRWDKEEFDSLIRSAGNSTKRRSANPAAIVNQKARQLQYPDDHILHYSGYGPIEKMHRVSLRDLTKFHALHYSPASTQIHVVGQIEPEAASKIIENLTSKWTRKKITHPALDKPNKVIKSKIYFYDVPDAKQSVLKIFRPAIAATHPDYALADAVNYFLGGNFVSQLNRELRINRGYTYRSNSAFIGDTDRGLFRINTSVRSIVTLEALEVIYEILSEYGPEFTQTDLDELKSAYLKSLPLSRETVGAKLSMLEDMNAFGYPADYEADRIKRIEAMTLEEFKRITATYFTPDKMNYLIVGDAKTQAPRLTAMRFGDVVLLNKPLP